MNTVFAIMLFLLFPVWVKAQAFQIDKPPLPIDSLKKELPFLKDSARVDCMNELARSYTEEGQWDSAIVTVKQAHTEASAINYIKGLGDACLRVGVLSFWHFWNFVESEKAYRQAIEWHQKTQDHNGLGFGFSGLGASLFNQGAADTAMKAFEQAVFHFGKAGNLVMIADSKDWFSYIYELKGDFEKQFENVKEGLREKKRIGDNRGIIWSYYNLSQIYQTVGDYETALDYLHQSFRQAREQSINWQIYRSMGHVFLHIGNYDSSIYYFRKMLSIKPSDGPALAGLGKVLMLRGEYDEALNYLQQASIIFKQTTDTGRRISVVADIGKTYTGMKQYTRALQYARECLTVARQADNKPVLQSAYEIHWNVYEALRNTDSAYVYFQKFVTLKHSLEDTRYKRQLLHKLTLYKVETKEEQQQARIALLHKDNQIKQQLLQKEALVKKILTGSFIALVFVSLILFRNTALKRKNEKHRLELAENELQMQQLESERTKAELNLQVMELKIQAFRAQMNPHFIFNSLNSINRFILKKQSHDAADYLTRFSRLIRMVLHSSESTTISLSEDLEALQLYLELESLRFGKKIMYQVQCDPDVDIGFIQVPPMLLQPYAENAIWHGLMLKEGEKQLWVHICQDDAVLVCTITDNGIGRKKVTDHTDKSPHVHKSMGMRITAGRIALLQQQKQRKASIQVTDLVLSDGNAGGTEVIIKIPIEYDQSYSGR